MGKGRLEAFSDGVLAIVITIMVLEMQVPQGDDWSALLPHVPTFLAYVLSFTYVGIYWNNHHHMFQACRTVTGPVLWANLHLLFWLSLIPVTTAWLDETSFASVPTVLYGGLLLMAGIAFNVLQRVIIASQGEESLLRRAVGRDLKGKASILLYAGAVLLALRWPVAALAIYVLVALLWLLPDRRIERVLANLPD